MKTYTGWQARKKNMLSRFGQVGQKSDEKITKKIYDGKMLRSVIKEKVMLDPWKM